MYLSSVSFQNFRCFKKRTVEFTSGLNLLIGENNSGKTAVLEGLRLLFERTGRARPNFDDFSRPFSDDLLEPPKISITARFRSDMDDRVSEKALVATWLTKVESPWEASITYEFFLPETDAAEFRGKLDDNQGKDGFFESLLERYLPKYVTRFWAGELSNQNRAEPDLLAKISLSFLGALRDAQNELSSGRNALLKRILTQILDQEIEELEKESRIDEFQALSLEAITQLKGRLDTKRLFRLVASVGAQDGGNPDFRGKISETDLLAALRLFIQQQGFSHPLDLNGLGYNNLIYISLVLASIQQETSKSEVGENAVVFAMLAIEEPEAHLHPVLQARLLRFIRDQIQHYQTRQVFLTSHSTHITSQCKLDSVICLNREAGYQCFYPGRALAKEPDSKNYLERYLDATKSNLLFLKGVILVEGPTELLLVSRFSEALGIRLEDHRVGVIVADGVTCKHFAHLFDLGQTDSNGLSVRLSCVVDADPLKAGIAKNKRKAWYKCFPYEVEDDEELYRRESPHLVNLKEQTKDSNVVRVFHGEKTFEYDFAMANYHEKILTDVISKPRRAELASYLKNPSLELLDEDLASKIQAQTGGEQRKLAGWATLYFQACDSKAEQADAIGLLFEKPDHGIAVPEYIEEAIKWACQTP